ncbi:tyrosine-type recombinase/integrase [Candidatus Woesearchaeota archaeon]|nr:tyrosine-type recombinase/integrase [Candidatus Woesearchaeota archaeon]
MVEFEPWNKGKSVGQRKPFTPDQVRLIRDNLRAEGNFRDLALFCVAVDTMLRASDLLKLKVSDVLDSLSGDIKTEIAIQQRKTGNSTMVTLTPISQDALARWIKEEGKLLWDYLFTGLRKSKQKPISRNYYRSLVKKWAGMARLNPEDYSSHSLRRTKASLIFQATNNVEVVRQLLGHSSVASTSAYLGVDKRQALEIARRIEI